jgi:nitrogen fixation NifU-like protein
VHQPQLLGRFFHPDHAGDLPGATVLVAEGNPACGDVVQLALGLEGGVITAARFRTLGCAVAIAASDVVCALAEGRTVSAASTIDVHEVGAALGGIPEERHACAEAPLAALRAALRTATPSPLDQVR